MKVIFDANVYDILASDKTIINIICNLTELSQLKVIATRTIVEELNNSPFQGLPEWFSIDYEPNTVALVGIMRVGDRLGNADIFIEHRGGSKKENDAHIVDSADIYADYLVSEDKRLVKRAEKFLKKCKVINYKVFRKIIIKKSNMSLKTKFCE